MSCYTNGRQIPNEKRLLKICSILKCEVDDLVPRYGIAISGAEARSGATLQIDGEWVWLTITHATAKLSYADASMICNKLGIINQPNKAST